jgi:hypothetical protein
MAARWKFVAIFAIFALFTAACGDDVAEPEPVAEEPAEEPAEEEAE